MSSVIDAWTSIPRSVSAAVAGLSDAQLDLRPSPDGTSIREAVHHLAEAQIVASGIIIAALGSPGCTFDWTWMQPFGPWVGRMGHRTMPIAPSLDALRGLSAYVGTLVGRLPDGLDREVFLRDAVDEPLRRATVRKVLEDDVAHAEGHLAEVHEVRRAHGL